jgi:hypothetical protein
MVETVRGAVTVLRSRLDWSACHPAPQAWTARSASSPPSSAPRSSWASSVRHLAVVTAAALGVVAWHYWKLHGVLDASRAPHGRRHRLRACGTSSTACFTQPVGHARAQARLIEMLRATRRPRWPLPERVVVLGPLTACALQWFNPRPPR